MSLDFQVQWNTGGLEAKLKNLQNLPSRRTSRLKEIIQQGILENYESLAQGNSISTLSGGHIKWSQERARMTIAIRKKMGLGAVFPILTLTGKLRRGLEGGVVAAGNSNLVYSPGTDIYMLVRAHQLGLPPLPAKSNKKFQGNMPPRRILFWSSKMARQVYDLAEAEVKNEGR